MLLSFIKFQVKLINFNNMSKSSGIMLNFYISQGIVATQLRWGGDHVTVTLRVSSGICQWQNFENCQSYDQKSCVLYFSETQCIYLSCTVS